MSSVLRILSFILAAIWFPCVAMAHPAIRCVAVMYVDSQGRGSVTVRFDALCFALNEEPSKASDTALWQLVDAPASTVDELFQGAAGRLERHVIVRADGKQVPTSLKHFPEGSQMESWKRDVRGPGERPRLPWMAEALLTFQILPGAESIDIQFPEVLGDVLLTYEMLESEPTGISLRAGTASPMLSLRFTPAQDAQTSQRSSGFLSFVRMGITHIIPEGLDHMLFILGLYLASPRPKSLLIFVSAFTLAHSVTLALTAGGFIDPAPRIVEPLIALSIAVVAIENLFLPVKDMATAGERKRQPQPGFFRAAIVFAFGLVHGMGFASAFQSLELPTRQLLTALVGFNVGVEIGQICVLAGAFALLGWASKRVWYRRVIVVPGSLAIACVGVYWACTR
ncbi:MAG: HupE/UreJ family protein [Phycisphaerales bacterium]|nr:HupE/UreJ family protein [Planctomycetota bacterium]